MIPDNKLDFWIKHDLNVLLIGKMGIGKSSIIEKAFERHGLKYIYFSAPTLDPWIDFVGIPKENKEGQERTIDYIRPSWHNDDIEAIFIDEINRAPVKVRNALLELLLKRSINGKKFPKLRFIWSATNPIDGGRYDVEELDDTQKDRFDVHYELPYLPDFKFFKNNYGENGEKAVKWWNELPEVTQNKVSPRRLEMAMKQFNRGGDLNDILPVECNSSQLQKLLSMRKITEILNDLLTKDTYDKLAFFNDPSNTSLCEKEVVENKDYLNLVKYLPQERISYIVQDPQFKHIYVKILDEYKTDNRIKQTLDEIVDANTNETFCRKLRNDILKINMEDNPLEFSDLPMDVLALKINKTSDDNITDLIDTYHKNNLVLNVKERIYCMECVFNACEDKKEQIKEVLRFYEHIASKSTDDLFVKFDKWLIILNNHLKYRYEEWKTDSVYLIQGGTGHYLRKNYPSLFFKLARIPGELNKKVIEVKR